MISTLAELAFKADAKELTAAAKQYDDLIAKIKGSKDHFTDAGSAINGLGGAARSATTLLAGMGGPLGVVGLALGVIGGAAIAAAGAIAAIGLSTAKTLADLDDLSNKTRISAERLSLLSALAAEGGSNINDWIFSAEGLTKKLAAQDEEAGKAAKALDALGISTKNANGEQKNALQLQQEIVLAAEDAQDQTKAQAAAVLLLGTRYYDIRNSIVEAKDKQYEMYEYMKTTGQVVTSKLAKDSGDFMDKIDRLKGAFTGMANSITSAVLPVMNSFLEKMISVAATAASIIRRFTGNETDSEAAQRRFDANEAQIKYLENAKGGLAYRSDKGKADIDSRLAQAYQQREALQEARRMAQLAEGVQRDLAVNGSAKEGNLAGGSGLGNKADKDAKDKRLTYDQITKMQQEAAERDWKEYAEGMEQIRKLTEARKKEADERKEISDKYTQQFNERITQIDTELRQRGMTQQAIKLENDLREIEIDLQKELNELKKKGGTDTDFDDARARAEQRRAARMQADERITAADGDMWKGLTDSLNAYTERFESAYANMRSIGESFATSLGDAFTNFVTTGKFNMKSLAISVLAEFARMKAAAALSGLFKFIAGAFGSAVGGGSGMPDDVPTRGGRASGGPVEGGAAYLVGEHGPEIVRMGRDGNVIPNQQLAAGGGMHIGAITITVQGGQTNEETAAAMKKELLTTMQQIADGRIANARRSGGLLNQY